MSRSFSVTESTTFTITHAKQMASRVAADLKRIQRFYNKPSDTVISNYEKELIELLKKGFLKKVTYGFKKDDCWIEPSLIYFAEDLTTATNDDPGKIKPGKNIQGASFTSFLEYSSSWFELEKNEQESFRKLLPFSRTNGRAPSIEGYLESDKTYSSGGKSLSRSSVRSFT